MSEETSNLSSKNRRGFRRNIEEEMEENMEEEMEENMEEEMREKWLPSRRAQKRYRECMEYLDYLHNNLSSSILSVQSEYPGVIPKQYVLSVCDTCSEELARHVCVVCKSNMCSACAYICSSTEKVYCQSHYDLCEFCEEGCTCEKCRIYLNENLCTKCENAYEKTYSCGCVMPRDVCVNCNSFMDRITGDPKEEKLIWP
jgi:hypothetical protein